MATSNPALNANYYESEARSGTPSTAMTVNGAAIKTGILTVLLMVAAGTAWHFSFPYGIGEAGNSVAQSARFGFLLGGGIGGLIFGLVLCFVPRLAPVLAPLYAVCEGCFLGVISGMYASLYHGIVLEAAMLTVGVLVMMLGLYVSGIIRMSDKLRMGICAATGGICLVYVATMLLRMFGVQIPYIHGNGIIGIGFSVVVIIIAALNLVLDFDVIEQGARMRAPKYMEWYSAYGLLVTLVWLYLEILRLLAKLNSSRD